jgi:peptide/nickel transport system substrate-binding protein
MLTPSPSSPVLSSTMPRRRALMLALGAAAAGTGGLLLSGCGGSVRQSPAAGPPKTGGTLRVGVITGGTAETLNPGLVLTNPDAVRTYALFDRLFEQYDDVATVRPGLATSAESNKDATVWTLHLRQGVHWHDGKPFTADDVVWTIRSWSDSQSYAFQFFDGLVDFANVRRADDATVIVPLVKPIAQFTSLLTFYNLGVIQNGATAASFARAVGTGPFKFQSFEPGSRSVFTANSEYWDHPYPYLDQLVVDSSFSDETPRLNALLSKQLDVLPVVPPLEAKQHESDPAVKLLRSPTPITMLVNMRVDSGPFVDPRVREALRLCMDRQKLIDISLAGYGSVADDVIGFGCTYFADDLKRGQDLDKARYLLKSAGAENLTFTLPTSNAVTGFVESATQFAQQAKAVGVTVNVQNGSAANYFGEDFLTRPIGQDQCLAAPSLTQAYRTFFVPGGGYNTTHWGDQTGAEKSVALLESAIGSVDPAKAADLWHQVQLDQFNLGGQIAWGRIDSLDLAAANVQGLKSGPFAALNNWRVLTAWLS